jgi:putative flippase GtrA
MWTMIDYTRAGIARVLEIDFVRFSIVGGTGFVINFIVLTFLNRVLGLPTIFAQLIGAEVALFSNFLLHNHWTYKKRKVQKSFKNLLIQFHATSWPAIVGSSLMVSGGEKFLHLNSLWALGLSSIIVLIWNFTWSKYVVWRDVPVNSVEELVQ